VPDSFLQIAGLKIRYRLAGRGPDVLLLHGWGGSIESFHPLIQGLSASFRTLTLDFPGHGQSDLPPSPWHVSDFLACTLEFMDRLELTSPHIVAHSFGGRVAIKLAAVHPERAAHLLMTAAAGIPARASLGVQWKRTMGAAAGKVQAALRRFPGANRWIEPVRERLFGYVASRDYRNAGPLRETLKHVLAEDLTPLLPAVRSKTLLIWGDQDAETPLEIGRKMSMLIPDSELIVFPGSGHFPYLDHTNKFLLLANRLFREQEAAS
jgi:pimeloyl-ACP methyl ester carboxylesterase